MPLISVLTARARVLALRAAALSLLVLAAGPGCFPDGVTDLDEARVIVSARDQNGAAVAGAQVVWWPLELTEDQASAVRTTGADGRVSFDIAVWDHVRIRITPPAGFAVGSAQENPVAVLLATGGTTSVTFSLVAE